MTFDLNAIRQGKATEGVRRVLTPEGVEIELTLASRAERAFAMAIDFCIQLLLIVVVFLVYLLILLIGFGTQTSFGELPQVLFFLGIFFLQFFYYLSLEVVWQGRTIGKRILGMRVVGAFGQPLSLSGLVVRNFMRHAEFFLPLTAILGLAGDGNSLNTSLTYIWMIGLSSYIFLDGDRRRLGDLMAGTIVVKETKPQLLPDIAKQGESSTNLFNFTQDQLETYGRFELQVLESVLRDKDRPEFKVILKRVVAQISKKIGYDSTVSPHLYEAFLNEFYTAQRQHLERQALYGKRKETKADDFEGP